ncbi:MAG TPA: NADH-quinone oxidoreductase subunit M, partial [Nitrospiria bacterium]|nr:NADH-quinone oxidoreductase subunit M [Nitrospiria bacterium]
LLMLVGFIILYLNHHDWAIGKRGIPEYSFGYLDILLAPISASKQLWVFFLVILGFAFKGPIFPFHTWLPGVMLKGPIAVGVLLSGVKLGSYGLLRFNLPFAPQASEIAVPLMMALSLVGLLYGAFIALTHPNLMTMMAYAGISHLGFVTIGLFALNTTGISGALLQMVNFGIVGAGMMFVLAFLMDRMDGSLAVADYGGVAKKAPVFASLSLVIVLASLALPGTNVFVGEFMILVGAFQAHWIYAAIGVTAVIFTAAYMLWMYERVMLGKAEKPKILEFRDLNPRETFIASVMVVFIIWIGLYPAPLLTRMEPSVKLVVERVEEGRMKMRAAARNQAVNPHAYFEIISDEEAAKLLKGSASGGSTSGISGGIPRGIQ